MDEQKLDGNAAAGALGEKDTRLRRFLSALADWTGRFEAPMKPQGGQAREGRT